MPAHASLCEVDETTFPEVLARAHAGDGVAWASIYVWLTPGLAAYLRLLGRADADDLARSVFLELTRTSAGFAGGAAAYRSYAFALAHHHLEDVRRAERATAPLAPWSEAEPVLVPGADVGDPGTVVVALAASLPLAQREVLGLRLIAGLPLEETAAVLGCTGATVNALQHEAVNRLCAVAAGEGLLG